jgi:microcystin-dependent protein
MSNPYVGEIRIFAGNFAPSGWSFCDGSILAISQNETLFNLIGTTYGGDGQTTFAVPDLRGRAPVHVGSGYVIGQNGGLETVALALSQMPSHTHLPQAAIGTAGTPVDSPANNYWSGWTGGQYANAIPVASLASSAIGQAGGSLPHDNMVPFLAINFIISLFGIYPSQT